MRGDGIHSGESMQQIAVEGSKRLPTGIYPHRVHVIVRLSPERSVRILFHAEDG